VKAVSAPLHSSTIGGSQKAAVPFILVCVLLDVLGFGLVIPVLPSLIGEFSVARDSQAYWYGVMSAVYGVMQFACAPLLGALSDRFGRRPVMLFAITGLGLDFLLMALAPSLYWLLAVRIIGGATAANFSVASAYIADLTSPEARGKAMGMIGAAFGIGFIIGPVIGGLLGEENVRLPFYVAAGLSLINVTYGFFVLPESLPSDRRARFSLARANPFSALKGLVQLRGVGGLVWVYALTVLAQFILHSTWVLYTTFRFGWTVRDNGISLFAVGLVTAIVQGGLLGMLLKRFGDRWIVVVGLASGALAFLCYGLAQQGWVMYAVIVANIIGFAVGPALQGLISKNVDERAQGITMGSLNSVSSIMLVIAPLIGAPLLATVSHLPTDDWRVGAPFYASTLLQLGSLAVAVFHFRRRPIDAPPSLGARPDASPSPN
jgi:DHA1 family tetracycline resistance protein-like MFS transporter